MLSNVVLTPNLAEAAAMLGWEVVERATQGDAAKRLRERGARAVLLKGGHLAGDPADALATADGARDLLRAAHRRLDARHGLHAGDGVGVRAGGRSADLPTRSAPRAPTCVPRSRSIKNRLQAHKAFVRAWPH